MWIHAQFRIRTGVNMDTFRNNIYHKSALSFRMIFFFLNVLDGIRIFHLTSSHGAFLVGLVFYSDDLWPVILLFWQEVQQVYHVASCHKNIVTGRIEDKKNLLLQLLQSLKLDLDLPRPPTLSLILGKTVQAQSKSLLANLILYWWYRSPLLRTVVSFHSSNHSYFTMVRMVMQDFPVEHRTNIVVGLHRSHLPAGLGGERTRVPNGSLGVFSRRHSDEHHGDVIRRLVFAQSKEVVHPWRGQTKSDQNKPDQINSN